MGKRLKTIEEQSKPGAAGGSSEAHPVKDSGKADAPKSAKVGDLPSPDAVRQREQEEKIRQTLDAIKGDPKTSLLFAYMQESRKETNDTLKRFADELTKNRQSVNQAIAPPTDRRGGFDLQSLLKDPQIQGIIAQFLGTGSAQSDEEKVGREIIQEAMALRKANEEKKGRLLDSMEKAMSAGLGLYAIPPEKAKELGLDEP